MFNIVEFLFPVIFILIFMTIMLVFAKGIVTWHKNNNSPRLTVSARIVSKRQNITYHNRLNAGDTSGTQGYHTISNTDYYVIFQVESGDRMEFSITGSEYGKFKEGDEGKLTFEGTRYLTFNREFPKQKDIKD